MCVPLCYDNLYTLKQVIESSEVHHFLIPNLPLSSSSTSSLPTGSSSSFPLASCYVHHNKPTLISNMAKIPYNKPAVRVVSCQNTKYNMYLDPVLGTVLTILTIVLLVSGFQEHYFLFYWFFVCFFLHLQWRAVWNISWWFTLFGNKWGLYQQNFQGHINFWNSVLLSAIKKIY